MKTFISILIIISMVLSSIGYAFLYMNPNNSTTNSTDANSTTTVDSFPIQFEADSNGLVKSYSKSYILVGDTNYSNITDIDRNVMKIKGVSNVESQFTINPDSSSGYTYRYRADVTVYDVNNLTFDSLVLSNTRTQLSNTVLYQYAVVEFSKDVNFINTDLNISKQYTFGNPLASVILLDKDTRIGDNINIKLYVTFTNGVPTKILGQQVPQASTIQGIGDYNFNFSRNVISISNLIPSFDINFIKKIDINAEYDSNRNTAYLNLFKKNIDLELASLSKMFLDKNVTIDAKSVGYIYVPYIGSFDRNYAYDSNVPVYVDYKDYNFNQAKFRIDAYKYNGQILGAVATKVN